MCSQLFNVLVISLFSYWVISIILLTFDIYCLALHGQVSLDSRSNTMNLTTAMPLSIVQAHIISPLPIGIHQTDPDW